MHVKRHAIYRQSSSPLAHCMCDVAMQLVDQDRTGQVEFGEFISWWVDYALSNMFTRFDTDGSGKLDESELRQLLHSIGIQCDGSGSCMMHSIAVAFESDR